jgi:MATE family multidrug resistance protein
VGANVILDALFVLGPGPFPAWGVGGAAFATLLANVATAAVSAWLLWRPAMHRRYGTRTVYRPSRAELVATLRVGLPMGVGDFVEVASFSAFFMILARVGVEALAASQIALQYMSLSFTMGFAIAMAAGSMVAQSLGAGHPGEAEGVGYRATTLAGAVMGLVGLGYLIAPEALIGVFSADPAVIAGGATVLRLVAFYQLFDAIAIVLGGALNGAGDTTFTMLVRVVLGWGGFLPLAWLLAIPLGGGVLGAWIGALAYLSLRGLVYFLRFRSGRWKRLSWHDGPPVPDAV